MSIEFILDGRTVTAEPGQTILDSDALPRKPYLQNHQLLRLRGP